MRQYYQKTAENLYNDFCKTHDREDEGFAEALFNKIKDIKTDFTIGFEGEADISYSIVDCLKSIDPAAANEVEVMLDKNNQTLIMFSRDLDKVREAVCQRIFHYGIEHLKNTIQMIEKYQNSLNNPEDSILDAKTIEILPVLKSIETASKEDFVGILKKISEFGIKTYDFCDDVEKTLRQEFVKDVNTGINATTEMFKQSPSRIKRLEGQKFDLAIHTAIYPDMLMEERGERGFSLSLIDDKNAMCYHPSDIKFAFYSGFKADEMLYAKTNDGSTDYSDNGEFSSFGVPDWTTAESFKKNTRENGNSKMNYSEISVAQGNSMRPDAIVCFDIVSQRELDFANKYNLDIILIDTSKYPDMIKPEIIREGKGSEKADLSQIEYEDDDELEIY